MTEMNFVEIDGYKIAYQRRGEGEPVLLIHGVASHSILWNGIIDRLAEQYDCLAVDLLGCGQSDKPAGVDYSIVAQAEIMMKLIDALGITPIHVIGHEIGGGVTQIMATSRPEQLIDLTMINPVGYDFWPVQPITAMRLPVIRTLTASIMNPHMYRMILRRAIFYKDNLTDALFKQFWQPLMSVEGKKGLVNLIRCINNNLLMDIADKLCELQIATLLIRGEADAYLSKEITTRLARDIPNARLENITTGGHFIQIDEPERISLLIQQFFIEQGK